MGQLSSTFTYGFQILMSLMQLSMIFVMVTMGDESAHRIAEVLAAEPTIADPAEPVLEVADGSIDFDHVSFKYSKHAKRQALDDIDLHITSGETIGIIGGTGSAKSTLVNLIARLYDTTEGAVRVGGVDVRDYDLDALRHQVAMVLQKNVLFSGTIAENLRWGDPNATDEEVREAAHLACADEFVDGFPKGYDTWIEQGGSNVSGGQKQRLCIARALLRRPKILILDDSTSAVDTKTDARSARAGKLSAQHDQDHHRPAHQLRAGRRPHHRHGGRPHRTDRQPRRAAQDERDLPRDLYLAKQDVCRGRRGRRGRHRGIRNASSDPGRRRGT